MGRLHLVQMAVEPVGSEKTIQGFGKYQGFTKMDMSSDTRAQSRVRIVERRSSFCSECYSKYISLDVTYMTGRRIANF